MYRTVLLRVSREAELVGKRSVRSKAVLSGFGALRGSDEEVVETLLRFDDGDVEEFDGAESASDRFFERRLAAVRTCLASLGSVKMAFRVSRLVLAIDSGLDGVS